MAQCFYCNSVVCVVCASSIVFSPTSLSSDFLRDKVTYLILLWAKAVGAFHELLDWVALMKLG